MIITDSETTQTKSNGKKEYYILVKCETCLKERQVVKRFAIAKGTHICRSCSSKFMQEKFPNKWSENSDWKAAIKAGKQAKAKGRYQSNYWYSYQPNHPRARANYVAEHHLVMEKTLGRYLEPHERVHHINGNKLDNRIENLFLCSGSSLKESQRIHNQAHRSAEQLTMSLVKIGLVEFKEGRYLPLPALSELFADTFEETDAH